MLRSLGGWIEVCQSHANAKTHKRTTVATGHYLLAVSHSHGECEWRMIKRVVAALMESGWVGIIQLRRPERDAKQHAQSGNFFGLLLGVDTTFFLMPAAAGEGRTNQGTGTPYCIS